MKLEAKQRLQAATYSQDDQGLINQVVSLTETVCSLKKRMVSIGPSHMEAEFIGIPSPASVQKLMVELKHTLLKGWPFRTGKSNDVHDQVHYMAFDATSSRPLSFTFVMKDDGSLFLQGFSRRSK